MKKEATTEAKLTRRGFVTAAGALGALGLAGCAPQAAEKMADTGRRRVDALERRGRRSDPRDHRAGARQAHP